MVLRPQARRGAQPPKAALSAERKRGCAAQKISTLPFWGGLHGGVLTPPYKAKQTTGNP